MQTSETLSRTLDNTSAAPIPDTRPSASEHGAMADDAARGSLASRYVAVRSASMALRAPLSEEDCQVQSMPEASPAKWHLAHMTWFFEQFLLARFLRNYRPHQPQFGYLFNSYYNAVGPQHLRPQRGLITRPSMAEVERYRSSIDDQMLRLMDDPQHDQDAIRPLIEIGLQHEQQHQELLLTDVKHLLWRNPLRPAYVNDERRTSAAAGPMKWISFDEGLRWIGHDGQGFSYDNERPRHRVFLEAFELASRTVTNGEYLEFMRSGGYSDHRWWLEPGWATILREGWQAPLYWEQRDGTWWQYTLAGMRPLALEEPVCHVSFLEADAYARWAGARLAREAEWETASAGESLDGNFVESGILHPVGYAAYSAGHAHPASRIAPGEAAGTNGEGAYLHAMLGDVWEWTGSPYVGYPGYIAPEGAIGEYNGKFMCDQWVLRGGSCASSASHIRPTYRNFFHAGARWQFSGIRLARQAGAAGRIRSS